MKHRKRTRSKRTVKGGKRHISSKRRGRKLSRRKVKGGKRHLISRKLSRKRTRTRRTRSRRKVRVGGMKLPWVARPLLPVELTADIIMNIALANEGDTTALNFLTKKIEGLDKQIKTVQSVEKNELVAMRNEIATQLEIAEKKARMSKQHKQSSLPSRAALAEMTDRQLEILERRHLSQPQDVKKGFNRIKTAAQAAAAIEETNRLQQEELDAMWTAVQEEPDIGKKNKLEEILRAKVKASVPDRQRVIVAASGEGAARTQAEDDAAALNRQMRADMAAQGRWADGTLRDHDRNAAAEAAAQPGATEADREKWVASVLAAAWPLNEIEKTTLVELEEIVKKYRPGGVNYKSRKEPIPKTSAAWDDLLVRHARERRELRERQDKEQDKFRKSVPQPNDPFELSPVPLRI